MVKKTRLPNFPYTKDSDLKGIRVTILGLGTKGGGVEAVKYFVKKKARVTVTDLKPSSQLEPSLKELKGLSVELVLGQHREEDVVEADLVIVNPGVPRTSRYVRLAESRGVPLETDISVFFAFCPAPIAGITGTRGKSTATAVAGDILLREDSQAVVAGNIRKSPLAYLDNITSDTPVVLELSSWQLEGIASHEISPHVAALTSILPDHLNRYDSFESYVKAKEIIFQYQKETDMLVLSSDDERVAAYASSASGRVAWFGIGPDAWTTRDFGIFRKGPNVVLQEKDKTTVLASWDDLKVFGDHTRRNMLGGAMVAYLMGARPKSISRTLQTFRGLPNRLEIIRQVSGRMFVNDTCATTPEAVCAALDAFPTRHISLIAGGTDKKLDMNTLAECLMRKKNQLSLVLLEGSATLKLKKLLEDTPFAEAFTTKSMEEAVHEASKQSRSGGVILLSPGAASFELFADEFDRGKQFRTTVEQVPEDVFPA